MNKWVSDIFQGRAGGIGMPTATIAKPSNVTPWVNRPNPGGGGSNWVGQVLGKVQEGSIPRPNPIRPIGSVVRRWHLTPWKTTEATALLDDLNGSNLGEDDEEDTGGWDVLNTLVGQAGNIYSASKGLVPVKPRPGQYLPAGSTVSPFGTMSTNTLLMLGAGVLAVVLLAKRK